MAGLWRWIANIVLTVVVIAIILGYLWRSKFLDSSKVMNPVNTLPKNYRPKEKWKIIATGKCSCELDGKKHPVAEITDTNVTIFVHLKLPYGISHDEYCICRNPHLWIKDEVMNDQIKVGN